MRVKGGAILAIVVALAVGATRFFADSAHSFTHDLDGWVDSARANLKDVDDGSVAATDFRVPTPIPLSSLAKNDETGKRHGEWIEQSESALDSAGQLTEDEARHLGCFLMTKAVNGELSLEPPEAEKEIVEYATDEALPGPPEIEIREELTAFRESLASAENGGEVVFRGALDFVCSSLTDELFE